MAAFLFGGDGAAREAVRPTVDLLESIVLSFTFERPPIDRFADDLDGGPAPE